MEVEGSWPMDAFGADPRDLFDLFVALRETESDVLERW